MIPKEDLGKAVSPIVLLNQTSLPVSGLLVAQFASSMGPQYLILSAALAASLLVGILAFLYPQTKESVYENPYPSQNPLS